MKHDTDTIVKDIRAAHPELAGEVAVVRAVVTELIAEQPVVMADESFKARLRAKLMTQAKQPSPAKVVLPWWLIYTVPVGVTALLLLTVYPERATSPLAPTVVPEALYPAESSLKMSDDAARSFEAAALEDTAFSAESTPETSDFFTATFMPSDTSIRVAYLSLSQPGFIVVTGPEGVVATSELLSPGEYTDVSISLKQPVLSGAIYTAALYYDTGDGVFSGDVDFVAHDQSGQPIMMRLVAP